jgi:hypothetical protein
MASAFTKKCRKKLWLFRILSWLCLAAPLIVYVIFALANDGIKVGYKVTVISMLLIALILTVFNIIAQKRLRCPIWIILIGLYIAIRNYLMPLIIILAVTSVLDDLLFTPLIQYYYTKTVASKTMDQREAAENDN